MEKEEEVKTEGVMPEEKIVEENIIIADEEPTTETEEVVAPEANTEEVSA